MISGINESSTKSSDEDDGEKINNLGSTKVFSSISNSLTDAQRNTLPSMTSIGARIIQPFKDNKAVKEWHIRVLAEKIQNPDAILRKRALYTLLDAVYDPLNLANEDFREVLKALVKLIDDESVENRQVVSECFAVICMSAIGRKIVTEANALDAIISLLDDPDMFVRKNISRALCRAATSPVSASNMVDIVPKLLNSISIEPTEIKIIILTTLHNISVSVLHEQQTICFVKSSKILIPLLKHTNPEIRLYATAVLMDSCMTEEGAIEAIEGNAISYGLELLHDQDMNVVAKAMGLLMMISSFTAGKKAFTEYNPVSTIVSLLQNKHTELRLNGIRLLIALLEIKSFFKCIEEHTDVFYGWKHDIDENVAEVAEKLIEQIRKKRE